MKRPTREWIEKAEEDWFAAKRLKTGKKPLYNLVCFHAQQCAEKYIKAFLEEGSKRAPRIHDLLAWINLAQPELNVLLLRKNKIEILTGYAVAFRYPGENALKKQAEESLIISGSIREIIRGKLKLKP